MGCSACQGAGLQRIKGDDVQGAFMCAFEDYGRCDTGFVGLQPAAGAQTPAVTGLEAPETVLGSWGDQIVALRDREIQKSLRHTGAHQVQARVVGQSLAAAIAQITGQGCVGAGDQWGAQNIACSGGHGGIL